jgi:hypothetical protein
LYPYNLNKNPFPSSPTPNLKDVQVLGGKRHQESRNSILTCIEDLVKQTETNDSKEKFRIITIIQDVGSGKTHLTLNIKISRTNEKAIISYLDMSFFEKSSFPRILSIYPKSGCNLFSNI